MHVFQFCYGYFNFDLSRDLTQEYIIGKNDRKSHFPLANPGRRVRQW
jgi:hypothetical protein